MQVKERVREGPGPLLSESLWEVKLQPAAHPGACICEHLRDQAGAHKEELAPTLRLLQPI